MPNIYFLFHQINSHCGCTASDAVSCMRNESTHPIPPSPCWLAFNVDWMIAYQVKRTSSASKCVYDLFSPGFSRSHLRDSFVFCGPSQSKQLMCPTTVRPTVKALTQIKKIIYIISNWNILMIAYIATLPFT